MKKFKFTLQTLKDYKEDVLDDEKNNLGILRSELHTLQTELEDLLNLIEVKNEEIKDLLEKGTSPNEITTRKRFISLKQQEVVFKNEEIAKKQREIEKQLNVVIECTKEVNTLEKLEEKQIEEYRALELKEEEAFIEEFVSNSNFRKEQSENGSG